ncbi:MAG TPA: carbohydrate ABC transporter permease [Chloroflexota bacterium]|nr:carbohydrate ABC transporter permease [Chloroflexota bacterium]
MAAVSPVGVTRHPLPVSRFLWRVIFYVVMTVVAVVTIFPLYWMLLTAIRPAHYSMEYPPYFLPQEIDLSSFIRVFQTYPLLDWLLHSGSVALEATALTLFLSVLGAYALSCLRWRGRSIFGFFLFFTQMLPETMVVIPIFVMYRQLGLVEKLWPLSLIDSAFVIPVGVWILKNVFDGVPLEVREAALVDGCGLFGVLWRIVLPLSGPGLVAVAVVAFFYAWNEYLFASTMITIEDIRTASVGLATFVTMSDVPVERILAGGLIYALPPAVFYLIAQRNIVTGLTAGAIKG